MGTDPTEKPRILVATEEEDDHESVLRSFRFAGLAVEIDRVQDGATVLEKMNKSHYDCIFIDPDIAGPIRCEELLDKMRSGGHRTPAIMMAEPDELPEVHRSLKAGATDFILKEKMGPRNLLKKLESSVRTWRMAWVSAERDDREEITGSIDRLEWTMKVIRRTIES